MPQPTLRLAPLKAKHESLACRMLFRLKVSTAYKQYTSNDDAMEMWQQLCVSARTLANGKSAPPFDLPGEVWKQICRPSWVQNKPVHFKADEHK